MRNLINFFGLLESKFICFALNYNKWKNCFKKIITNFDIFTLGNEVYLHRVIYLKNLRLTESDLQVFCMFLNERINK